MILEVAVDTLEDAIAAEAGGAHRIELCADLAADGLSPAPDLVMAVRGAVTLPIHAMVRPRPGNFFYTEDEFRRMEWEIGVLKSMGVNGIVLGMLNEDRSVDVERCAALVRAAAPLPVTFHRAFDAANDAMKAFEDVLRTGAARLLTSGQQPSAVLGKELIRELSERAADRIIILPGAGITAGNVVELRSLGTLREVHAGKGVKRRTAGDTYTVDPALVREFVSLL